MAMKRYKPEEIGSVRSALSVNLLHDTAHGAQERHELPPLLDRLGSIAPMLKGIGVTGRCAR